MNWRYPASIGAIAAGGGLLFVSVLLLRGHFQALKDVREFALPLAAEVAPLEERMTLLTRQTELSAVEASLRSDSAEEKLHVYVLPDGDDLTRLLAFMETVRTYMERGKLVKSFSPIDVGDAKDDGIQVALPRSANAPPAGQLRSRELHMTMVVRPEARSQLFSILRLSGLITVGDVLSPQDIHTLFNLTEGQNYAGIVPVEQFLSADLLAYTQDSRLYDQRLSQALSSEDFLSSFHGLLQSSALPGVETLLQGDLGRALVAQKLWPIQFMTIENENVRELPDDWEKVDLTLKAYSRTTKNVTAP